MNLTLRQRNILYIASIITNITLLVLFLMAGIICYFRPLPGTCPADESFGLGMFGVSVGILITLLITNLCSLIVVSPSQGPLIKLTLGILLIVSIILVILTIVLRYRLDTGTVLDNIWYAFLGMIIGLVCSTFIHFIGLGLNFT